MSGEGSRPTGTVHIHIHVSIHEYTKDRVIERGSGDGALFGATTAAVQVGNGGHVQVRIGQAINDCGRTGLRKRKEYSTPWGSRRRTLVFCGITTFGITVEF